MEYFEIRLDECRFYAYHGVLPHEREIGNDYILSIAVKYPVFDPDSDDLANSISYADLYEIAKKEMETPRLLLETVTAAIGCEIKSCYPSLLSVKVTLTKITPPIPGCLGSATVVYHKDF